MLTSKNKKEKNTNKCVYNVSSFFFMGVFELLVRKTKTSKMPPLAQKV